MYEGTDEKGLAVGYPSFSKFKEDKYSYLIERLENTNSSLLRARYAHILWCSPKKHTKYAKLAVDSYLELISIYERKDKNAVLSRARDMHIWLVAEPDGEIIRPFKRRTVRRNYYRSVLAKLVPGWQQLSDVVFTGQFDDGVGYILIDSWAEQKAEALEYVYVALWEFSDAPALIIDVRPNDGSSEALAQQVAGCFIDEPKVYARHVYRAAGEPEGFTKPRDLILEPNKRRPKYRGKIAVLMGRTNMGSCEAFLLMMKQSGGCKLIGDNSYGSSGKPEPTELGNGVTVFLPSSKVMQPDVPSSRQRGLSRIFLLK